MSTDYTGIALIVTPVMAALVTIVTLLVNNRSVKKVDAKVEKMGEVADETLHTATLIHHGVNGKAPGEPSLSEDVTTIKEKQEADSPTVAGVVPVVTKSENGSLRLQVAYLTKLMEDQLGKTKKESS